MHNLHYILVNGDNAEDAARNALNSIEDWGNENNWRSVGGVIALDGSDSIENHEDAGFPLRELVQYEGETIMDKIHASLGVNKPLDKKKLNKLISQLRKIDTLNGFEIRSLQTQINDVIEVELGKKDEEVHSGEFDEFGLTDYRFDGGKEYVVMIDMHS